MKPPNYSAIIAAAGSSSRMGFPKALLKLEGEPAAFFLAQRFWKAHFHKIYVALPPILFERPELIARLHSIETTIIANHFFHCGYAGSIMSVMDFAALSDGIFITPIDTMFTHTLIIAMKNLARAYLQNPVIIVPYCDLKPGHPVYLSRHFFSALKKCDRYGGLHRVIEHYKKDVLKLASFDRRILYNFNDQKSLQPKSGQLEPLALN